LALPVIIHSGSMYPIVPASTVVCEARPWSSSLASPKSPSLALKAASSITLLG
jgi:hypothetical protein